MPEYTDLLYEIDANIATITLNRPDRLNAITGPMLESISQALRDADHNREVRVIVLTGAGRGFCAGLDLKDLVAGTGIGSNGADGGLANARFDLAASPPVVLHTTDKPVICAINGPAAGYGMDLALGADIRIASSEAKLAAVFTKRGILPESGGSWLLPRLIGWEKAAEIAFAGRTLSAQEALEAGLISRVVEPRPTDADGARPRCRDRRQRAARRAGDEAHDAPRPRGDVRGERAPRLPPAPPALRLEGLPRGRPGVHREAPAAVPGAIENKTRGIDETR